MYSDCLIVVVGGVVVIEDVGGAKEMCFGDVQVLNNALCRHASVVVPPSTGLLFEEERVKQVISVEKLLEEYVGLLEQVQQQSCSNPCKLSSEGAVGLDVGAENRQCSSNAECVWSMNGKM